MKQIQTALKRTGIPAYPQIWKATKANPKPPAQYLVYSAMRWPEAFRDDESTAVKTTVYLNLWSQTDPTAAAKKVRDALALSGWAMEEEGTGTSSGSDYDADADMYSVSWTWTLWEDANGDED